MDANIPQVFIDANIMIAAGKPPGGSEITRLADLVEADMIEVLTTDLTITEIAKKHAENDFQVVKDFAKPHVRRVLENVSGTAIPVLSKDEMRERLLASYHADVAKMFERLGAKTLSIDYVSPSVVFEDYARSTGFFAGDGKKDQFSDAFIFRTREGEGLFGEARDRSGRIDPAATRLQGEHSRSSTGFACLVAHFAKGLRRPAPNLSAGALRVHRHGARDTAAGRRHRGYPSGGGACGVSSRLPRRRGRSSPRFEPGCSYTALPASDPHSTLESFPA